MTGGVFSVAIQASPEEVWRWVADLGTHAEWSPKAYTVEWLSGEPNAVGSRYRSVGSIPGDSHHVNEGEIVESHPFDRFSLRAEDPGAKEGTFSNSFTLTADGDGTLVTFRLLFPKMKGAAAVLSPVVFSLLGKRDIRQRLSLLKAKVEGSA